MELDEEPKNFSIWGWALTVYVHISVGYWEICIKNLRYDNTLKWTAIKTAIKIKPNIENTKLAGCVKLAHGNKQAFHIEITLQVNSIIRNHIKILIKMMDDNSPRKFIKSPINISESTKTHFLFYFIYFILLQIKGKICIFGNFHFWVKAPFNNLTCGNKNEQYMVL